MRHVKYLIFVFFVFKKKKLFSTTICESFVILLAKSLKYVN